MDGTGTAAPAAPRLAPLLLRERVLLLGVLALAVALSWAWLVWMAADAAHTGGAAYAHHAHGAAMPGMAHGGAAHPLGLLAMWAVMAVAMMLPTALPLVLLFARLWRGRHPEPGAGGPVAGLVLGYLAAWLAFGAAATALQLGLERAGLLVPALGKLRSAAAGGAVLATAGLFQLTPLKAACLARCRSPLMFLMTRWRDGRLGPFAMGLDHGLFCLGCCWALMLVMFAAGAMDPLWMAALTVLMTAEKVAPRGDLLARAAGAALVAGGLWLAMG